MARRARNGRLVAGPSSADYRVVVELTAPGDRPLTVGQVDVLMRLLRVGVERALGAQEGWVQLEVRVR